MLKPIHGTTMCAEMVNHLMLVVHAPEAPSDSEWSAYCDYAGEMRERRSGVLRTLVVTPSDSGPNAKQRAEYREKVAGSGNRIAVLCAGSTTRAILTAMSWFNRDINAFGKDEFEPACRYLGVPWTLELEITVRRLQERLVPTSRVHTGC